MSEPTNTPLDAVPNMDGELKEQLAAIEHERWAHWQQYMHSLGKVKNVDGVLSLVIPTQPFIHRWERQINTPYSQLSEAEQKSDIEQVDRYWPLIVARDQLHEASKQKVVEQAKWNVVFTQTSQLRTDMMPLMVHSKEDGFPSMTKEILDQIWGKAGEEFNESYDQLKSLENKPTTNGGLTQGAK